MADDTITDPAAPETEAGPQVEPTESKDGQGGIPKEVQSALRKANKEAETLRLKLKEFEDRDKTEAQKLADRAAQAEKERDEARLEAIRLEVAQAKGLTPGQTKRLVGASRDELEADADQLVADLKQSVRPSGSVDQGQRGGAPKSTPQQDFADVIARHMNRNG